MRTLHAHTTNDPPASHNNETHETQRLQTTQIQANRDLNLCRYRQKSGDNL